jgi:polyhydroxyalkanoate synthesis regulator phasin
MPLRTFTYNEVVSQPQEQVSQTVDYASKSDIEKLSAEIEALREQIGKKKEK